MTDRNGRTIVLMVLRTLSRSPTGDDGKTHKTIAATPNDWTTLTKSGNLIITKLRDNRRSLTIVLMFLSTLSRSPTG